MDPLALWIVVLALLAGAFYFFFGSFVWGAGFEPMSRRRSRALLDLAEVGPSDRLFDLGAGTGAIVFAATRERGAEAVAVEIEPIRVGVLRLRRRFGAAPGRLSVVRRDLFQVDLRTASVVTTFLWPAAMLKLREKLERELPAGARVVSYYHTMPGWTPARIDAENRLYLYRIPALEPRSGGR